ncbi:MAG: class I SAM-dependent methyltransferase [Myxococcota bacterium]|jgi:SAM-dependent methyltransferase|nr:class I SAM-dependent methyltransferase [Myxococcota bacterium]
MAAAVRIPGSIEQSAIFGDVVARAASYAPERVAEGAIGALDLRPTDAVLELGCGSGRLLARVTARVQRGAAVGVDPSPLMVRHARFRNRRFIERGLLEVEVGASGDLSRFSDGRFDKVYGMHVVYFWEAPARDLAEIRRVLRPGGRLVLGFCPDEGAGPTLGPDRARCSLARAEDWLIDAGFTAVSGRCEMADGRALAWLIATR